MTRRRQRKVGFQIFFFKSENVLMLPSLSLIGLYKDPLSFINRQYETTN